VRWLTAILLATACSSDVDGNLDPTDGGDRVTDATTVDRDLIEGLDAGFDAFAADARDTTLVDERPFELIVPAAYAGAPTPLVILLHGYGATGPTQSWYMRLAPGADRLGYILATPDGRVDATGQHFWNATDACCNYYGSDTDDVAYVNAIIDDVSARYNIDPKRVFLVGHSNGGFMSHRTACDLAPRIAAIVSLAGAQWKDTARCTPSEPVSVLEVHGTWDAVIYYDGGKTAFPGAKEFPAAPDTVAAWAALDGCTGTLTDSGVRLDIDTGIGGAETVVAGYTGCPAGLAVELWSVEHGGHLPGLDDSWPDYIYTFLQSHPKR
jgi:polyhydroxybutyrate depolymerase